jgi:hypothetical protein
MGKRLGKRTDFSTLPNPNNPYLLKAAGDGRQVIKIKGESDGRSAACRNAMVVNLPNLI